MYKKKNPEGTKEDRAKRGNGVKKTGRLRKYDMKPEKKKKIVCVRETERRAKKGERRDA